MKFEYCEVIDLTLPITSGMDIPTGLRATLPPVEFKLYSRAEEQGLQVGHLSTPIHAGTHLDTPRHIYPDGKTLDEISMDAFIGKGICVDVSQAKENEEVTVEMLLPYEDRIQPGMVVFLYTGWSERMFGTLEYWNNSPVLSTSAADWLVKEKGAKMLGYDFFQDAGAKGFKTFLKNFLAHEHVLGQGALQVEHLTNLSRVVGKEFFAIALPLKIVGGEGSPTRVIALM